MKGNRPIGLIGSMMINWVNEHRRSLSFISAGTENMALISADHLLIVLLLSVSGEVGGQEWVTVL